MANRTTIEVLVRIPCVEALGRTTEEIFRWNKPVYVEFSGDD